jgi:hypothetical protein
MVGRKVVPNAVVRAVMCALPSRYMQVVFPDRFEGGEHPIGSNSIERVPSFPRVTIWKGIRLGWFVRSEASSTIARLTDAGLAVAPPIPEISPTEESLDFSRLHRAWRSGPEPHSGVIRDCLEEVCRLRVLVAELSAAQTPYHNAAETGASRSAILGLKRALPSGFLIKGMHGWVGGHELPDAESPGMVAQQIVELCRQSGWLSAPGFDNLRRCAITPTGRQFAGLPVSGRQGTQFDTAERPIDFQHLGLAAGRLDPRTAKDLSAVAREICRLRALAHNLRLDARPKDAALLQPILVKNRNRGSIEVREYLYRLRMMSAQDFRAVAEATDEALRRRVRRGDPMRVQEARAGLDLVKRIAEERAIDLGPRSALASGSAHPEFSEGDRQ